MKPYLFLFFCFTITISCLRQQPAASHKQISHPDRRTNEELEKVTILYVPLATKAAVVVSCDQLRTVFGKKLKTLEINDLQRLKKIDDLFQRAVSTKESYMNIRVKFILHYADHTETYCMDREGTLEGYDSRWEPELVKWFKQEVEK